MSRKSRSRLIGWNLGFALLLVGCDSDNTGPGSSPADFSGSWDLVLEVSGKRLCDASIGDILNGSASIAQDGRDATLSIDPDIPIPLTISGSRANGGFTQGDKRTEFALEIRAEELGGTMTFTDSSVPCSEVLTITGSRNNAPPSGDFAGYWDLQTEVTESGCEAETTGESKTVCRRIRVDNSTVTIEDEAGPIRGVGDGEFATLRRSTADERLTYRLNLDGGQILGELESYDLLEECYVTHSVVGTRRTESCVVPSEL